jgi:hypothetical protein
MEAVYSSETSDFLRATRCYKPQDSLHTPNEIIILWYTASWELRSYLEEIVAAPVKKTETNDRGDPLRWPRNTLYTQKLVLLRQQAAVARSA